MTIDIRQQNGQSVAVVTSQELLVSDGQSALDFLMSVQYETRCNRIALNKEALCEDFFRLTTGLAGEILQKVVNYKCKFAIYGDFSRYTSKPLQDFIRESNRGDHVFFVDTPETATQKLADANE